MKLLLIGLLILSVFALSMSDLVCKLESYGINLDPDKDGIRNLPQCWNKNANRPGYCYVDFCGYYLHP